MIKINQDLQNLSDIISKKSPLYIVGGFVRDSLLNIENNDIDICSNLKIDELKELLNNTNYKISNCNYNFGTCKVIGKYTYEYTTFRKDTYNLNGNHFPLSVQFCQDIKLDSTRRDFTINALYYDITNKKIIDFYNAQEDLKNKLLKALPPAENTLKFDAERILRMIKFCAKYNLEIEQSTLYWAKIFSKNIINLNKNIINKFIESIKKLNQNQQKIVNDLLLELGFCLKNNTLKGL